MTGGDLAEQSRTKRGSAIDNSVPAPRWGEASRATAADGAVDDAVVNRAARRSPPRRASASTPNGGAWLLVRGQIPFYKSLYGEQNF